VGSGGKMKHTLTKEWDETWERTQVVHLLGTQLEPSDDAKVVGRAMGELSKMKLPIKAVNCIGYAVYKAYECGRKGSMK
jgi:hypothetical protein